MFKLVQIWSIGQVYRLNFLWSGGKKEQPIIEDEIQMEETLQAQSAAPPPPGYWECDNKNNS